MYKCVVAFVCILIRFDVSVGLLSHIFLLQMKDVAPLQTHVELPSADVEVVPPKVSTSGLMSPRHKPMPSKLSHEDTERIPDAGSATSLALTDGDEDEGEQREDIEHEQPEGSVILS